MSKSCDDLKGFTLIEVMVALAIFAMAASMLLLSDGNSIRQTRYMQEKILASQIADHYLNVLHAEQRWEGDATRPQVQEYAGYQWYVREKSQEVAREFRNVEVEVYMGADEPEKGASPLSRLTTQIRKARK